MKINAMKFFINKIPCILSSLSSIEIKDFSLLDGNCFVCKTIINAANLSNIGTCCSVILNSIFWQ